MKKWLKMTVMSVLALGVSALLIMPESAAETVWTGDGDGVNWEDEDNWDNGVPDENEDGKIDNGDTVRVVDFEADVDKLKVRDGSRVRVGSEGVLLVFDRIELEGGNISTLGDGFIEVDESDDDLRHLKGDSTINLSGSGGLFVEDTELGKDEPGGSFTVNISGSARYIMSDDFDARAEEVTVVINITESGEMDVNDEFDLRTEGTSVITVDGPNTKFNIKNYKPRKGSVTMNLLNGTQATLTGDANIGRDGLAFINISGGSSLTGVDDIRIGRDDGSGVINISDDSFLSMGDKFELKERAGDGSSRVNLSDEAVFTLKRMSTDNAVAGIDWVDFQDDALMIFTGESVSDVEDFINDGFMTAQAGGFVDFDLTTNPGDITLFRVPVDLGDIPFIDLDSQGKTPLHLKLTDVDVSTLLIGDPDLGGTPVSPVKTNDNGNQTIIHVNTQEMIAVGVLDGTTDTLLVTGNFLSGAPFWAFGALNAFEPLGAISAVPEPSSLILLGLGSMGLLFRRKR